MTGVTGQSDSGLVMDPEDRERAGEDLAALKVRIGLLIGAGRGRQRAWS